MGSFSVLTPRCILSSFRSAAVWMVVLAVIMTSAVVLRSWFKSGENPIELPIVGGDVVRQPEVVPDRSASTDYGIERTMIEHSVPLPTIGGSSSDRCIVTVRDVAMRPVASAEVELWSDDGKDLSRALTDVDGICRIGASEPPGVHLDLLVHATGHARFRCNLPSPLPATHAVVLRPPALVTGRVELCDGRPAPVGTMVYALPAFGMSYRGFAAMRTRIPASATDMHGEFNLEDLDPGSAYGLVAAHPGWCCLDTVRLEAGQGAVPPVIRLHALYGRAVNCSFPDGSIPPDSTAWSVRLIEPETVDGLTMIGSDSTALAVAGVVNKFDAARPKDWRAIQVVFAADSDLQSLPGFGAEFTVPGIESGICHFDLVRITDGMSSVNAQVRAVALGFGKIVVAVKGPSWSLVKDYGGSGVRLVLQPLSDASKAFCYPLTISAGSQSVEGVPFGVYQLQIESPFGWVKRYGQISVGQDPVMIEVSEQEFGVVVVEIEGYDGSVAPRGSMVAFRRDGGSARLQKFIRKAPYVAYGVPPGTYHVTLESGVPGRERKAVIESLEVGVGGVVRCRVRWGQ